MRTRIRAWATSWATVVVLAVAGCGSTPAGPPVGPAPVKPVAEPAASPEDAARKMLRELEDAIGRDAGDPRGPARRAALDRVVGPFTDACVSSESNAKLRTLVVRALADARDPRAERCFVHVLEGYRPGEAVDDVRLVARAVGAMKLRAAAPAMRGLYVRYEAGHETSAVTYRDVHDAVMALADSTYEEAFLEKLQHPIDPSRDMRRMKSELFWQITAAEALGLLKSERATQPLLALVMDRAKVDAAATAVHALTRIGKPAETATRALFGKNGATRDEQMNAAVVLAVMGRRESVPELLRVLRETKDDLVRAVIARELQKLPPSEETTRAFKTAFDKTPPGLTLPNGSNAREQLLEYAPAFFDPSLVPWIVSGALEAKGAPEDVDELRHIALISALKMMKRDQIATVERLANKAVASKPGTTVGAALQKEIATAKAMLEKCDARDECYLAEVVAAGPEADRSFGGIKAAYTLGTIGTAKTRDALLAAMPRIASPAARYVALLAIDRLSPDGGTDLVARLDALAATVGPDGKVWQDRSGIEIVALRIGSRTR